MRYSIFLSCSVFWNHLVLRDCSPSFLVEFNFTNLLNILLLSTVSWENYKLIKIEITKQFTFQNFIRSARKYIFVSYIYVCFYRDNGVFDITILVSSYSWSQIRNSFEMQTMLQVIRSIDCALETKRGQITSHI